MQCEVKTNECDASQSQRASGQFRMRSGGTQWDSPTLSPATIVRRQPLSTKKQGKETNQGSGAFGADETPDAHTDADAEVKKRSCDVGILCVTR